MLNFYLLKLMDVVALLNEIRSALNETSQSVDRWFDAEPDLLNYRPENGGWTVAEILEHTSLTNHFLLILIQKGTNKAMAIRENNPSALAGAEIEFHREGLTEVGLLNSFAWMRPAHMEPTGEKPLHEVRLLLREQFAQCLHCLDRMANGEGFLYKTTMTVNALGKINVYEYIYFLAQHARRHLAQMERNQSEMNG